MRSISKKIISLVKNGLEPLEEGLYNFNNPISEVEQLAKERSETCKGCPFFKIEPISFLRVEDKRIPLLSSMFCDNCGCTLSYKTRQSITKCDKWQE